MRYNNKAFKGVFMNQFLSLMASLVLLAGCQSLAPQDRSHPKHDHHGHAHDHHKPHRHQHKVGCGHKAEKHDDHVDFAHNGHKHHAVDNQIHECEGDVDQP